MPPGRVRGGADGGFARDRKLGGLPEPARTGNLVVMDTLRQETRNGEGSPPLKCEANSCGG